MPKIAVVLSGCGVYDGSEIHETAAAMAALTRGGAEVIFINVILISSNWQGKDTRSLYQFISPRSERRGLCIFVRGVSGYYGG